MASTSSARANDTEFLVRKSMTRGYQWLSLVTPPAYIAFTLVRRGPAALSVSRTLRATWLGGAAGCAAGGAFEYTRSAYSNEEAVRNRRIQTAYNTSSIRADDHSTIGSILFATLTPALLWKRARVVHLILGGAGIGSSVGLLTHYGRTLSGDQPPKADIPSLPAEA